MGMIGTRIVEVIVGSVICWALGSVNAPNMAFAGPPSFVDHQEILQTQNLDSLKLRISSSQQSSPSRHPPLSPREISDIVAQTHDLIHQAEELHARGKYYRFNRGLMFELFSQLEQAKERQGQHDFIQAALMAHGVVRELTEAVAEREKEEEQRAKTALVALLDELEGLQKGGVELAVIKALEKRIESQEKPLRAKAFLEVQAEAKNLRELLSKVKNTQGTVDRVRQEGAVLQALGVPVTALLPIEKDLAAGQQALREGRYQDAITHLEHSSDTLHDLRGTWKTLTAIQSRIETAKDRSDHHLDLNQVHPLIQRTKEALQGGRYQDAKTTLEELQEIFKQHQITTVGSGMVVLIDEKFVDFRPEDKNAEGSNLVTTLTQLKHPYTTIAQLDVFTVIAATSENAIIILPSLDHESLLKNLDEPSRKALKTFVETGGTLLTFYPNKDLFDLVETLFGWRLEFGEETSPFRLDIKGVPEHLLQEAPIEITYNYHLDTVAASSLPSDGKIVYSTGKGDGVLTYIPYGVGGVWIFGWDWKDSVPTGTQDGGWLKVLNLVLTGDLLH
ncbi:MAG: hypothetical protein AB7F90_09035 [Nitrospirales bacterium]